MSDFRLKQEKLPPALVFLTTVCPGLPYLDENTHFSVSSLLDRSKTKTIEHFNWPLTGLVTSPSVLATLEDVYLNVARPPYQTDDNKNAELSTYVLLPLHITSLFAQVVQETGEQNDNSNNRHLHIGASVNPLVHDPFRLVLLNAGCLSAIIRLPHEPKPAHGSGGVREPLNKLANSLNRVLRFGTLELSDPDPLFHLIPGHVDAEGSNSRKAPKDSPFAHLVDFNQKLYYAQMDSPAVQKLLVSVNINVLNIFALDEKFDYANTSTVVSTNTLFPAPQPQASATASASSTASVTLTHSQVAPYNKVVERPILRLQFKCSIVVTSMLVLKSEPAVVLGLNTGEVIYINLCNLTYRHFTDLGADGSDQQSVAIPDAITAINAIVHPSRGHLLILGNASGEVMILDPFAPASSSSKPYKKTVTGKDKFVTFFKKFDLSFTAGKEPNSAGDSSPAYIVGHFKLSHKPITCIASTIAHDARIQFPSNPMIIAIASEDGFVRFIDLIATHGKNYGDPSNFYNLLILTDIISCYFQDGVRFIEFSPDFRFICICGKGDSIEIFKMSYYNVNGLLLKNNEVPKKGGRSRSNTITSSTSNTHNLSLFSPPMSSNTSQTFEMQREDSHEAKYPPTIKDIVIVSRFKAHTNTVERIAFVKADEFHQTKSKPGHDVYNFISCGKDGNVMVWELNTKALTKTKKTHLITAHRNQSVISEKRSERHTPLVSESMSASQSQATNRTLPSLLPKKHQRNRSITSHDDNPLALSFSALGINNLLGSSPPPQNQTENSEEQSNIVNSLYRSLYELRLKKHYGKQESKHKFQCVLHGIVDDSEVPIMRIPLLTMNLLCLIKEASISGFHLASNDFWIFGSTGDIFRYKIE
ncbi:hypothetical protein PUMCH_004528 [Australozyma saopauloensis]|uniref:Uncharacterized protein n=1 Tax=Australozyma saopauloensis TaxID=291208 RepID=A0AAX4HF98_9ASCO|nr:hypothetical protein PUMCH_004528 [[Candida] saopauloensis]